MSTSDNHMDKLLPDAVELAREYDRVSASLLQRRLRIRYARASLIIEQMEELGYIGPFDGSNGRAVLRVEPIDFFADDPDLVARFEVVTGERSVLGFRTPSADELVNSGSSPGIVEALARFECPGCGRLESTAEASTALVAALTPDPGEEWWQVFIELAVDGELRAAVIQREQGLTFEQASHLLDATASLGLIRRTGNSWDLTRPRCSHCIGAAKTNLSRASSGGGARETIPAQLRFRVLQRDGFRCAYCGQSAKDGAVLHVDHVVPVASGGETTEDNLLTACASCNLGKATTSVV